MNTNEPRAGMVLSGAGTVDDPFLWVEPPTEPAVLTPAERRRAAHQRAFERDDAHEIHHHRKDDDR